MPAYGRTPDVHPSYVVHLSDVHIPSRTHLMDAGLYHDLLWCPQFQEEWANLGYVGRNCPVQARIWAPVGPVRMDSSCSAYTPLCDDHCDPGSRFDVDDVEMAGGRNLGFQGVHRFVASAAGGSHYTEGTTRDTEWSALTYHESGSGDLGSPAESRNLLSRKWRSGKRPGQK